MKNLTEIFSNEKNFQFFIILALCVSSSNTRGDPVLSSILTDDSFVDDDICSTIINEHPCVKNILGVMVDLINSNLQGMKEDKIQMQQQVDTLADKLQEVTMTNKRLKRKINNLETKHHSKLSSNQNNFLNSFFETSKKSHWKTGNDVTIKMDNLTVVRFFYLYYEVNLEKILRLICDFIIATTNHIPF